jgi:hypothetical protein
MGNECRNPVVGAGITGLRWFFKPGPAHLDTLEFSIVSDATSSPDVFLRYTGFIDRYVGVKECVVLVGRLVGWFSC